MKSSGNQKLDFPREQVFEALNNVQILRQSIPGCESIEKDDEGKMNAVIVSKVGPVRATFKIALKITEAVYPHSYKATGEGKGAASLASGSASAQLSEDGSGTFLEYEFEANIGGKLAQLGSRVIESFANKFAADFFRKFDICLRGGHGTLSPAQYTAAGPEEEQQGSGHSRNLILAITAITLLGAAYFLSQ